MPTRQEMWDRLGSDLDVLIIGGGINGAGIARDAARRGLRAALVEMGDLASGTSSRSSKLVHGGLRYLEQFEFSLVFEAVSERRILMDIAPHLVNPLGFLFPVYKGDRRNLTTISAGMVLYEGLSLFRSPKRSRKLKRKQVAEEEPALTLEGLKGAPLYYDCSTDDARLTLENALSASEMGAVVAPWTKVVELHADDHGTLVGATVRDQFTGATKRIAASVIVNATGPWTDRTLAMAQGSGGALPGPADGEVPAPATPDPHRPLLRPTKGVHIVVPKDVLPVNHAIVLFHPDDGRVLFALPWSDATYVGTTDTDYDGDPGDVRAERADIEYLKAAVAKYFPQHPVTDADIICTWAGLRPLVSPPAADGDETDESSVSREHRIIVGNSGLISIAGGKLTTYRLMSKEVVDTAAKMLRLRGQLRRRLAPSRTEEEPLPGAVSWPEDDDHDTVARQIKDVGGEHVSLPTARLLADTYGMRGADVARRVRQDRTLGDALVPGRPEILAQVDHAVQEELASTVTDVLKNRTALFYRCPHQGLAAAQPVADRMASLLGWDEETRAAMEADYRDEVQRSRMWRDDPEPAPA
jgi:glycerol-3-phosphate dehydrogenase